MKPGPADLRLWEVAQARDVPGWVRDLEAVKAARPRHVPRAERLAALTHQAINARAGARPAHIDLRNTLALLGLVRRNQARALIAKRPDQFQDNPELRNLTEYMLAHGFGFLNGRAYSLDATRYVHYRRFLRRAERAQRRADQRATRARNADIYRAALPSIIDSIVTSSPLLDALKRGKR